MPASRMGHASLLVLAAAILLLLGFDSTLIASARQPDPNRNTTTAEDVVVTHDEIDAATRSLAPPIFFYQMRFPSVEKMIWNGTSSISTRYVITNNASPATTMNTVHQFVSLGAQYDYAEPSATTIPPAGRRVYDLANIAVVPAGFRGSLTVLADQPLSGTILPPSTWPTADFTASPTSGLAPLTVYFTSTSTGNIETALWSFGDGVASTITNPVHTYTVGGTYTVNLTVAGLAGSDSLTRMSYVAVNGDLVGTVALQGREVPSGEPWRVPLRVQVYSPGSATPAYSTTITADDFGRFSLPGISTGNYTITVKNRHTLTSAKPYVQVGAGTTDVNICTLFEGDANDDGRVTIIDFSILSATYGIAAGDGGFDGRADFNESRHINIQDFSLLAGNYGKFGDQVCG